MSGVIKAIADLMKGDAGPGIWDLGALASSVYTEFSGTDKHKTVAHWRDVIAEIPFEAASFSPIYGPQRADFERRLAEWCVRILDAPEIVDDDIASSTCSVISACCC